MTELQLTDTALVRKLNLKDKLIKQFTPEEKAEYRHRQYMKNREKILAYQKARYWKNRKPKIKKIRTSEVEKEWRKNYNQEYYKKNRERINKYYKNKYRIKCGLEIKE